MSTTIPLNAIAHIIGNLIVNEVAPRPIKSAVPTVRESVQIDVPERQNVYAGACVTEETLATFVERGWVIEHLDQDRVRVIMPAHTETMYPPRPPEPPKPDPYSWIKPGQLAELAILIQRDLISYATAKRVIVELCECGGEVRDIIGQYGLLQSNNADEMTAQVTEAITANPKAAAEFKAGNDKALNAIKGHVMKATQGKANPKLIDEIARRLILGGPTIPA